MSVNQEVYRELARNGTDVTIVVPSRWRHEYSRRPIAPSTLEGLEGRLMPLPVAFTGRPQRHFYLASPRRAIARTSPDLAFIEAEAYSLAAAQWGLALHRHCVPFGVQAAETIDRPLPLPVRLARDFVLRQGAFVAARSETAAQLAHSWGARGRVALVPHAAPSWKVPRSRPQASERVFTVGYAGRLVPEKGLGDLLAAVRRLDPPVELLLAGNGPLRATLEGQPIPGSHVQVLAGLAHEAMAATYARMDVLVLPSRTTRRWKEQFGRVIVEALSCGVPVIGSDSGEIPWLIRLVDGGLIFEEGNVDELVARLVLLRARPELRSRLAATGRATVERLFTVTAVADALRALLESAL